MQADMNLEFKFMESISEPAHDSLVLNAGALISNI